MKNLRPSVAVLDIGSNSIKVLVATRGAHGAIEPLHTRTIDARIGAGLGQEKSRLSAEGMARGLAAIRDLLADVAPFSPASIALVATSAVRDAQNGADFRARVRAASGHEIRILSGDEEANLIGRGLTSDPTLRDLRNFYVFDLGGGSLECLAFRDRRVEKAVSLQLGCVRLTEKFVADPTQPLSPREISILTQHVRETFAQAGFTFGLPSGSVAVGTGGTVTTARAIRGARTEVSVEKTDPVVTREELETLLRSLGEMPLVARQKVPGLPPARADVFPAALATLLTVADLGGFGAYRNSLRNLRYGLAAEMLERSSNA